MLIFGQERSNEKTALAAEPCCVPDCSSATPWSSSSLTQFQAPTTTPKGWPLLICNIHWSPFAHNGSSTPSQLFPFSTSPRFDCFPVPRRVSLPIHVYGPASSAQVSLLSVHRTFRVHGFPLSGTRRRHRPRI